MWNIRILLSATHVQINLLALNHCVWLSVILSFLAGMTAGTNEKEFIFQSNLCCSVIAHDIDTGNNLWFIERCHPEGITAIRLSHNMRFLLSGGMNGEVRLWELRSRELISHMKEHTQRITDIVIFPDDTAAMTASRDRCIMHWDLREEVGFVIIFD